MAKTVKERKFWQEFVCIYRENVCLWDENSPDFKNQSKKNLAYGILVEKLWEIDENADVETVKKQLEIIRSRFLKDIKGILKINSKNKKTNKGYVPPPSWCYYHFLSHLMKREDLCLNADPAECDSDAEEIVCLSDEGSDSETPAKKIKPNESTIIDIMETQADWEDVDATFAAHVKTRMRTLDPEQRCIAQKLISDVVFMAQTKQLQVNSEIVKAPGRKP